MYGKDWTTLSGYSGDAPDLHPGDIIGRKNSLPAAISQKSLLKGDLYSPSIKGLAGSFTIIDYVAIATDKGENDYAGASADLFTLSLSYKGFTFFQGIALAASAEIGISKNDVFNNGKGGIVCGIGANLASANLNIPLFNGYFSVGFAVGYGFRIDARAHSVSIEFFPITIGGKW